MLLLQRAFYWNYILSVALVGWFCAQVLKTGINAALLGHLDVARMWGDGGMPSAHSATVCSMVVACARYAGTNSAIFGVACVVAIITMHDAMGVRRETGEQSKILNQMLDQWAELLSQNASIEAGHQLKEMVGHTPVEVICGAALGLLVGFLIPLPTLL